MSFIAHMIISLKSNKRNRVSAFEKIKNFKEGRNIRVSFDKKASKYQLNKIKENIKAENKKALKSKIIVVIIFISILIYVIGFVKI